MLTRDGVTNLLRLDELETPRLLLDMDRLERNCAHMRERCRALGVALRPHLKTTKSLDVARIATGDAPLGVTVSTLKEAEYFARTAIATFSARPASCRESSPMRRASSARPAAILFW